MKIICVGRNYAKHAKELNNAIPSDPVIFMKPPSALLVNDKPFFYPEFTKDLHYEVEVVLKIGKNGRHIQKEFAHLYYQEVGLGIDFTARDLQAKLKDKGKPWELAKGFDFSAVLSKFIPMSELPDTKRIEFSLEKNGATVQSGNTANMLFSFDDIIVFVSKYIRLQMGDYIYTGTPAGVGPVAIGDKLEGFIQTKEGKRRMFKTDVR